MASSIKLFKYIVKDLVAALGNVDGLSLVRSGIARVRDGDETHSLELPSDSGDVRESVDDMLKTLADIRAAGALGQAEMVLDDIRGVASSKVGQPTERRPSAPLAAPPIDTGDDDNDNLASSSSDAGTPKTRDSQSTPERLRGKRPASPDDNATDDGASDGTASDSEDDYIESDTESFEDDAETTDQLVEAFRNTYFGGVEWSVTGACMGFTLNSPDWRDWVHVVSKMGELLEAPKTLEAIMVLRISCRLMEDDFEAQDLVNPDLPVFHEFWKRGRAVCSCIMQGGKTRRCILLRGYVHAGVHDKHALVLANGMAAAYTDMDSAMQGLNEDYRVKVPKTVRQRSRYLPEKIFLFTRLNQVGGLAEYHQRESKSTVHFNVRLSNTAALNSMATPFRNTLEGGFTSETTHLILDESHEALGKRIFACDVRDRLRDWQDVTLVTATPIAQFVVPDLIGETFRSVEVIPRPGYYLYGPDAAHPERDSEDGKILVVAYIATDATEEGSRAISLEAHKALILKDFPHAFFPLSSRAAKKARTDADPVPTIEVLADMPKCAVPQEYVYALARLAQLAHSHFCIVLNEVNGKDPTQGGSSINIGHAVIAKWIVQNTTMLRERERDRRVTRGKRASIVAYTVYQYSRTSSEFAKPRLFFNRVFLGALGRCSESNKLNALIDKVFTSRAGESHSRVLLKEKRLDEIRNYLREVTAMARRVFNKEESDSQKLLDYGDDTFSLELPRLEIKAVLSLVRHLHESRFQKEHHSYETMPLKLTIVGNTLLKQSVNVESKCRKLQSTHLMYIRKEGAKVDVVRLLQKLGRVDHGHTDSPFYRSAFPGAVAVSGRRPTVLMSKALIQLVLRSPARQQDAVERGAGILPDFHRETAEISSSSSTLQASVPQLNEQERETHRAFVGRLGTRAPAAAEGASRQRNIDRGLLDRIQSWIRTWTEASKHSAVVLNRMARDLHDQIVEGYADERPTLADLRDMLDEGVNSTATTRALHRFLMEVDDLPLFGG